MQMHSKRDKRRLNVTGSVGDDPTTSITLDLMRRIAAGDGVFVGGGGIMVRDVSDAMIDTGAKTAPASFFSNDLFMPNPVYQLRPDASDGTYANIVAVFSEEATDNMFGDADFRQDDAYDLGVFYPADANAVDQRCRWEASDNQWDCKAFLFNGENPPGDYDDAGTGYIKFDGTVFPPTYTWVPDSTAGGTAAFVMGNPNTADYHNQGGGTGCHMTWSPGKTELNGNNGDDTLGNPTSTLTGSGDCDCNVQFVAGCNQYAYSGQTGDDNCWGSWVDKWTRDVLDATQEYGYGRRDPDTCWLTNLRSMINLQNWFWLKRSGWLFPDPDPDTIKSDKGYWGWNEVPVNVDLLRVSQVETFAVSLPIDVDGDATKLPKEAKTDLDQNLCCHVKNGWIVPGEANVAKRPGSYVVLLKQFEEGSVGDSKRYQRSFFCEEVELEHFIIRHHPITGADPDGACFVEYKDHGSRWCHRNHKCTNWQVS